MFCAEIDVERETGKHDADSEPLHDAENVTEPEHREENGEELARGGDHGAHERAVMTHGVIDEDLTGGAGERKHTHERQDGRILPDEERAGQQAP